MGGNDIFTEKHTIFQHKHKNRKTTFNYFFREARFFSSSPGHSCINIRDYGDSEGDGEYWIDPAKNGNPLKVYCDMTTDGGTYKHVNNHE